MNYIMISPHFPENFETFAHRLHESGINTLGIADEPYENLKPSLKEKLTEYYRVDDMHDYDQMYRAVAYFAHKYGKIDRIESHNEFWLETDAKLRTDFNVFGYKEFDMGRIKRKSGMKAIFELANVPVARGRVFKDKQDAKKLVKELGLPVIIKPDIGVGGSNTYKIKSLKELDKFFEETDSTVDYIMEEYIDGDIVTFDGLTDQDGNIVFCSTLTNSMVILDILGKNSDMYYQISREIPEDIMELGTKSVQAFDIKERFFHFEFFRLRKDQSLIAIEINCRPPGGATIDMFNYANDIDIFKEYANVVQFNRFEAEITRPYFCAYISRKSHYHYTHSKEEIESKFIDHHVSTLQIPGVFASLMGDLGFIMKTTTQEEMEHIIQYIHQRNDT